MALSGDLVTMGLEDIFQLLAVGKKTGVLELKGTLHTKRVAFHEGRITSIWSSDPREYLGQYLLAFNRITEDQLREALATQENEQQLLGRILIDQQLVTEAEIRHIMQLKVEESIFDTFLWSVGSFEFHDGARSHQKSMLLSLDVTGIVLEGARRQDDWTRIRKVVKGGDAILSPISEAIAERLPLAREDADVLARLDGIKQVDQLVIEIRMPEYKVNKLLFDLHERGLVHIVSSGGHPGGTLGENPRLHLQRARALVEKQKLQEAQEELRRILLEEPRHLDANKMMAMVQDLLNEKRLDLELIPELAVSLDELMATNIGPNEAFLASRVNGLWSIREVLSMVPFEPNECLGIFSKLLQRGILKATKRPQEPIDPKLRALEKAHQDVTKTPAADPEVLAFNSPLTANNTAKTPMFIQAGEKDRRVPGANAFELRQGPDDQGVKAELLVNNVSGHGITKPKAMRAVIEQNLQWFNHYIFGDPLPDFARPELPKQELEKIVEAAS